MVQLYAAIEVTSELTAAAAAADSAPVDESAYALGTASNIPPNISINQAQCQKICYLI